MSLLSRLRLHRNFSTILNPDSSTPLSSKAKSRAALSLIKSESNPQRIIDICKSASLTPLSHLDRIAFSVAISKLTDSKSFDFIRNFLEDLKSRPDLRNERFISHSIVLYGQAGMLDQAIQTFEKMNQVGVDPSVKSLNALLFSCILSKKYDEVNRIFVDFSKKYSIKPNLDTYNTVIKAFCEMGKSSSGFSLLAEMDRKGIKPNATSFGTMLAGCYNEEKYDDVGKVLKLIEEHGMRPGLSTYNIRIQSLCKLRKSSEAKALFEGMLLRGMKVNSVTYSHLIHGFAREGNLEEAKELFRSMTKRGCNPDGPCYFTLLHFLCQSKDFETALEICKECTAKGWYPNFSTMKLLVEGLASISNVDEARELVGQVKEKFSGKADLWDEIEKSLAQ
ncbi:Pentatricopeptide repeat [Dillenia turbinata]|uniref:Pentatricopeptide repeat n=1 Tax=Dillenia turbinata TaxID=194707 RepID=A0AAN8UQS9_9MAGN